MQLNSSVITIKADFFRIFSLLACKIIVNCLHKSEILFLWGKQKQLIKSI